jgi:hypothetical protein
MNDERCVVCLATGDEPRHPAGLERLRRSLVDVGFDGRVAGWPPGSYPRGCPSHLEVPFAFKPYCLAQAREGGARWVLWIDASCVAVRPLDRVFAAIERDGYLLFRNPPWRVGQWASDLTLERFGLTRDEALELPEVNAARPGPRPRPLDRRHLPGTLAR